MNRIRKSATVLALTSILFAGFTQAQNYPDKPVRIVAPGAGGGADLALRLFTTPLSAGLGQSVVVDNRGGNMVSTIAPVVQGKPDGYTLLFYGSGMVLFPMLNPGSFDLFRDFAPITLVDSSPNVLVVHPSLPVKSVAELIALAKSKPGTLNYAGGSAGTAPQLAAQLFNHMAGVDIVRITYKGTGQALSDLVAGRVQIMFASSAGGPFIQSGKLKALAVTSAKPSALYPDLPTVAAAGKLPGYEVDSWHGLFAPAGTPAPILNRVASETAKAIRQPDVKSKFASAGLDATGNTPQEFSAQLKSEVAFWSKIVKEANLKDE